ncbi:MAG: prolipoprotein diacylglyceryl transferase [Bacteroidales bacterium]|nr:prolipoprotein diacylglyceryl transferase [Bacteroidales bacterium]
MLLNFINWNVDPVMFHIGNFGLRYYSLGFLFAFLLGYFIFYKMFTREKVATSYLDSLVLWMFVAVLVGARLGHCLFYEPGYFCTAEHWPEIFLPFNLQTGQFTGYQGLASHGAAIAILITLWIYCRKNKMNFWWLFDRLVIVVALGGAFIRLGNLFNSEIYGVETSLPWGFIFERNCETVPKHPTQLYEALSYLIIFVVCYIVYRKKNGQLHNGRLFGWWLVALFGMRFLIEFVKEEQVDFEKGMTLDMGQWLSVPFILGGIVLVVLSHKGILKEGIFTDGRKLKK